MASAKFQFRPAVTIETLTEKHVMAIRVIGRHGSLADIAKNIGTGKTYVQLLIEELKNLGLIEKYGNKYILTEKGSKINGL